MDDVTDVVFRQIVAECTKPDLFFTEFVNVDGLQSPGREHLMPKLWLGKKEDNVIAQLWGLKPENFYKTVKQIRDGSLAAEIQELRNRHGEVAQGSGEEQSKTYKEVRRASTIADNAAMHSKLAGMAGFAGQQGGALPSFVGADLNMGCPVKTVTKNGACAALINNKPLASEIIAAVQEAAGDDFPVSVKTRVGFTTVDMSWPEFLLSKKLNMLSIHGRTAKQMSKVSADWDLIGQVREMRDALCPSTLVVGNGDVKDYAHGVQLAKKYKLDGIMIGRGIFEDPFAFAAQSPWEQRAPAQKISLFKRHIDLHLSIYKNGERRFETLRKFCKVYINGFDGASDLRAKFMETKKPQEALELLDKMVGMPGLEPGQ